ASTSKPKSAGRAFFFQAEDGIRALYVTGVQTCALPISHRRLRRVAERAAVPAHALHPALRGDAARAVRGRAPDRDHARVHRPGEIGRASCRERGWMWVVAGF